MRLYRRGMGSLAAITGPVDRNTIVAFDILEDIDTRSPNADAIIQRISQTMPGGVGCSRMTLRGRYAMVDDTLADLIADRFPGRAVRLRDLGASNAIVSVELFRRLAHIDGLTVEASDHMTTLSRVQLASGWRVLFNNRHDWIQAIRGDTVLYGKSRLGWKTFPNDLYSLYVGQTIAPEAKRQLRTEGDRISLFHPEALELSLADPRFTLAETDLFTLPEQSCEVARLMTVVMRWPAEQQRRAFTIVGRSLVEGGLLTVGQGRRPSNMKCGVFERRAGKLVWLRNIGKPAREQANVEAVTL